MSTMDEDTSPYLALIPPGLKEVLAIISGEKIENNPKRWLVPLIGTPLNSTLFPPLYAPLTNLSFSI